MKMNNQNQNDENAAAAAAASDTSRSISRVTGGRGGRRRRTHLSLSHTLTHPQLLRRRLHKIRLLIKYYRQMYWLLMNQLKLLLRQYISNTGLSPFQLEQQDQHPQLVVADNFTCAFAACHNKPMPCTTFCFLHILSDPKQQLYKPCQFLISSAHGGALRCNKPIGRSTVPSYCDGHMQIDQQ